MKRAIRRCATVLAVGVVVLVGVAGPVQARPVTEASGVAMRWAASTPEEVRRVVAYWTPQAMRDAAALDVLVGTAEAGRRMREEARASTTIVPPRRPVGPMMFPNGGGVWTGGGAVVGAAGRVFFTVNGSNSSCSATAVSSANRSTVITAGHCVKITGRFHQNWVFVPGYDNGNAPFGTWTARQVFLTPQWMSSEDLSFDIGAVVVNDLDGALLTDVVGGQGVAFNQSRGQDMYAFGWPAAGPYDGTTMIYCSGTTFDATLTTGIGMYCDLTAGASGGAWLQQFDESSGTGVLASVNSYKMNFVPDYVFGPYFGMDAQNLYDIAETAQ